MQKGFNTTTLIGKFIKQLVATFPVPIVSTWEPGQYVVADLCYVSKDYILKARHNGNPKSYNDMLSDKSDYYFDIICPYVLGYNYDGITTKYISNSVDYDSTTHYYLGEYLRLYRIIKGIDLMPYYNCFSGSFANNVNFTRGFDGSITFETTGSDTTKIAIVPVKYGKTYTIGVNCGTSVEMALCFYDGSKFLTQSTEALNNNTETKFYEKLYNTTITKPFTITTPSWDNIITTVSNASLGQFERYFTLFIKLPATNSSAIAVVEGDVSDSNNGILTSEGRYIKHIVRNFFPTVTVEGQFDLSMLTSPLTLFQYTGSQSIAFSDRLIEYLLLNVIDSAEEIGGNISRVQKTIEDRGDSMYAENHIIDGVWTDEMREYLYNTTMSASRAGIPVLPIPYDINGYVDKDTERLLV